MLDHTGGVVGGGGSGIESEDAVHDTRHDGMSG
jgi:hypothetical protein